MMAIAENLVKEDVGAEQRWRAGMHWRLEGKRLVITGSTKGIGLHAAREALNLGAHVLLVSRSESDLFAVRAKLLSELGTPEEAIACHACDVGTAEGRATLVAAAAERWGGACDALVNNVGTNVRKPIGEVSPEEYNLMFQTNCSSCFFLCQAFQPLLEKGRSPTVVNVSSVAGVTSSGTGAPYAMTKAAMVQLTRSLACEWAPLGIRVNCVAPWMTMTPLLRDAVAKDPTQLDAVSVRAPHGPGCTAQPNVPHRPSSSPQRARAPPS
jgi:Tropinone reductase 1